MEPEEEPSVAAVREVCEEVCAKACGYYCTLSQPTEWCVVIRACNGFLFPAAAVLTCTVCQHSL